MHHDYLTQNTDSKKRDREREKRKETTHAFDHINRDKQKDDELVPKNEKIILIKISQINR